MLSESSTPGFWPEVCQFRPLLSRNKSGHWVDVGSDHMLPTHYQAPDQARGALQGWREGRLVEPLAESVPLNPRHPFGVKGARDRRRRMRLQSLFGTQEPPAKHWRTVSIIAGVGAAKASPPQGPIVRL